MVEVAKYIFLFLIGTTVLNLLIAIAARIKTGYREYNLLIIYWITLFITYFSAALLSHTQAQIAFAYFFQTFSSFLFIRFLAQSRGVDFRYRLYIPIHIVGMLISGYLIVNDYPFTQSLLPVTITMSLPFIEPIWKTLVSERSESIWIEKFMAWIAFTGLIHHFDYALFRMDPNAAWWGWSISIAQYQCFSVLLPLLVNHHRSLLERMHVGQVMQKLAGPEHNYDMEIEELYRNLENLIVEKDLLNKKLASINMHLEEEREMNEILIKTISHDIANPLAVIKSYIELIQSGRITHEEQPKTIEKIKQNSISALSMIKRIRNAILTRNQSSMTKVEEIPIMKTLASSLESFDSKLKEKELTVHLTNHLPSEFTILADEKSLQEHVFANVITNAIKFSYRKSTIQITASELENHIRLEFKDSGIGMAPDRLEKRTTMPFEGTEGEIGSGLGFVLMGYFLRKFGGRYQVLSEGLERGTTVRLDLRKSSSLNV